MNPIVKEKWVSALRSGEFEQGKGFLKQEDKFCCLGVLCELYVREHGLESPKGDEGYFGKISTLPQRVGEWAGITNVFGGTVKIGNSLENLASHNDDGVPFETIASTIDNQL